ncbi:hypothetical protein Hsw_PB0040 (plasmid) [Hymenobacter swuensis DY53]|uniref:Uncharacterized protein n=2 Tax=Hymenobacter TaxID=89966 RepID=W8F0C3_9BACT|nr:hypothetical protein Hsw_PB0040 [Hymenobacter swuensis DY53]
MKEFFHISTTTEFMLLDLEAKQVSMPSFLDIEMEPFSTCVSLAIGLTRGHLLTRFQGSLWPAFILPAINPDALIAEVKRRDTPSEQPSKKARPSKRKPGGLADEVIKPTDDLT